MKQPTDPPAMRERTLNQAFNEITEPSRTTVDYLSFSKGWEAGYQAALPSDAEIEGIACRKATSILEPDPNHPDDDTAMLHFPNGCELVEGREFWRKHLTELFAAILREELRGGNESEHNQVS